MTAVSEISATILESMAEMTTGSQQISAATQHVSDLSYKTKDAMDKVNELINRFKI